MSKLLATVVPTPNAHQPQHDSKKHLDQAKEILRFAQDDNWGAKERHEEVAQVDTYWEGSTNSMATFFAR